MRRWLYVSRDLASLWWKRATKVQSCDDESDEEHDDDNENKNENDNDSDDDEPTKDKLIDMLEDVREHFDITRRECKNLRKERKALSKPLMSSMHLMRG